MTTDTLPLPMYVADREWIISMALAGHTHRAAQQTADCECWHCQHEPGDPDGHRDTASVSALIAAFRATGREDAIEQAAAAELPVESFTDEQRRVVVLAAKTYLVNSGELAVN